MARGKRAALEVASNRKRRHRDTEQARRKRIDDAITELRQRVGCKAEAEKAEVLEEVITFVDTLRAKVASLAKQLSGLCFSAPSSSVPAACSARDPCLTQSMQGSLPTADALGLDGLHAGPTAPCSSSLPEPFLLFAPVAEEQSAVPAATFTQIAPGCLTSASGPRQLTQPPPSPASPLDAGPLGALADDALLDFDMESCFPSVSEGQSFFTALAPLSPTAPLAWSGLPTDPAVASGQPRATRPTTHPTSQGPQQQLHEPFGCMSKSQLRLFSLRHLPCLARDPNVVLSPIHRVQRYALTSLLASEGPAQFLESPPPNELANDAAASPAIPLCYYDAGVVAQELALFEGLKISAEDYTLPEQWPVVLVSSHCVYLDLNQAACELMEMTKDEMVGKALWDTSCSPDWIVRREESRQLLEGSVRLLVTVERLQSVVTKRHVWVRASTITEVRKHPTAGVFRFAAIIFQPVVPPSLGAHVVCCV